MKIDNKFSFFLQLSSLTIKFFSREVSFLLRQRSTMTSFPEVAMYCVRQISVQAAVHHINVGLTWCVTWNLSKQTFISRVNMRSIYELIGYISCIFRNKKKIALRVTVISVDGRWKCRVKCPSETHR